MEQSKHNSVERSSKILSSNPSSNPSITPLSDWSEIPSSDPSSNPNSTPLNNPSVILLSDPSSNPVMTSKGSLQCPHCLQWITISHGGFKKHIRSCQTTSIHENTDRMPPMRNPLLSCSIDTQRERAPPCSPPLAPPRGNCARRSARWPPRPYSSQP